MVLALLLSILPSLSGPSLYTRFQKKIMKQVALLFEGEVTLHKDPHLNASRSSRPVELLLIETSGGSQVGYLILSEAPSKVEKFSYMVIFNQNGVILAVSILQYRENYGGEISSKRFLRQFVGKTNGKQMSLNQDIDGISGATISAMSITRAIREDSEWIMKYTKHD